MSGLYDGISLEIRLWRWCRYDRSTPYASRQSLTVDSDVEVVDEVSGRAKKLVRVGHGEALTTNLHVAPDHILVL